MWSARPTRYGCRLTAAAMQIALTRRLACQDSRAGSVTLLGHDEESLPLGILAFQRKRSHRGVRTDRGARGAREDLFGRLPWAL